MTHEPECPHTTDPELIPKWRTFINDEEQFLDCTFCSVIRAAYQRGLDEAAKAIHKQVQRTVKELLEVPQFTTAYEYQRQQATGMVKAFETVRQIKSDIKVTITGNSK